MSSAWIFDQFLIFIYQSFEKIKNILNLSYFVPQLIWIIKTIISGNPWPEEEEDNHQEHGPPDDNHDSGPLHGPGIIWTSGDAQYTHYIYKHYFYPEHYKNRDIGVKSLIFPVHHLSPDLSPTYCPNLSPPYCPKHTCGILQLRVLLPKTPAGGKS